jgi:2-dehydro-3-deoxyphosphogluconate aldolase/(4S)-4-hydroxy-2-oxoglutarate aldolase
MNDHTSHSAPDAARQRRQAIVDRVVAAGAVAVVRLPRADQLQDAVRAIADGGVIAIEVTLTTPGALAAIELLRRDPALCVGAGSVLDAVAAREAIAAGAEYLVSPIFDAEVLAVAHAHGAPMMPGAYTPTEIHAAHRAGADIVKVFPADGLGPSYLKGVLAPMPFLSLMPTGGVTPENAGSWIRAGAVAVGLGSALVDPALVAAGDWGTLTARAQQLRAQVVAARS